jgi:hypothetical protein
MRIGLSYLQLHGFVNDKCCMSGDVWGMVEERNLQLAPPPGVQALDPLLQLQQNLAALNQVKFLYHRMLENGIYFCPFYKYLPNLASFFP